MKNTTLIILALAVLLLPACAPSAPTPLPPPTPIPTPVDLGKISPLLRGSNYGPWVAVPVNMLDAAYNAKIAVIRFPGGAWGDRNTLRDYQIDAFMDFCKKAGATATISVNLRDGTPEQAAELVRYVNITKKYGIIYWAIGNEPTLYAQEVGVGPYGVADYNRDFRAFAKAMKAVDPSIKLMGPELHQYAVDPNARPKDASGLDWMDEFLRANGDLVDVVTFHRYPFGTSITPDDLRRNAREWDDLVIALRGRIHELTGRDIPIALTEVNTHYNPAVGGIATPDSHFNAVWLADVFGQMVAQDVLMFNHWLLSTSGSNQGGWGMISRSGVRPSYYVYQLYALFGTQRVYAASGIENVSIYAAKRPDGALTLMIINLNDDLARAPLQVAGKTPASAQLFLLDPSHNAQDMGVVPLPADGVLDLPGQSVSLYVVTP
ncbi:MAG: hypothetical protein WHV44_08485 [Anaerolineales bacterium]